MSDPIAPDLSAGGRLHALTIGQSGQPLATSDHSLLAELERVIGLADAIQLHELLKDRPALASKVEPGSAVANRRAPCVPSLVGQLHDDLLGTRQGILKTLGDVCNGEEADSLLRWPNLEVAPGVDGLAPAQRLERFYIRLRQVGQIRIQELRQRTRRTIAPLLPRLVELDSWLEQALTPHLERGFAVIPRLLRQQCEDILANDGQAVREEPLRARQDALRRRVCSLFIAELDVRLEPVLGLIEALEDLQE